MVTREVLVEIDVVLWLVVGIASLAVVAMLLESFLRYTPRQDTSAFAELGESIDVLKVGMGLVMLTVIQKVMDTMTELLEKGKE